MTAQEKENIIAILSNFETRSNKDIMFLMEQAFKAGRSRATSTAKIAMTAKISIRVKPREIRLVVRIGGNIRYQ